MKKILNQIARLLARVVLFICLLFFFSAVWHVRENGYTGFDSVLFTLQANLGGVDPQMVLVYFARAFLPTILAMVLFEFLFFRHWRLRVRLELRGRTRRQLTLLPLNRVVSIVLAAAICGLLLYEGLVYFEIPEYLNSLSNVTELYEQEYISPDSIEIRFPEAKRNLIYIFAESLETGFFSRAQGGAEQEELLPRLYALSQTGINFSNTDGLGGFRATAGTGWTIASTVAQTAGIPLSCLRGGGTYGQEGSFLPGAVTLMDILHQHGYYQQVISACEADFGGTDVYFGQHGIDRISDVYTARSEGVVAPDYFEYWGMSDQELYIYAKRELDSLSSSGQPFALYLSTMDTHAPAGYICPLCGSRYSEQYENAYACADNQLCDFIEWLQTQPCYENTTVIICGDHPTMAAKYVSRRFDKGYARRVFDCILNSPVAPSREKSRDFTAMDLFPTTLAALGCSFDGDRLGLGANLFSDQSTLSEQFGFDALNEELRKRSNYYNDVLLYPPNRSKPQN